MEREKKNGRLCWQAGSRHCCITAITASSEDDMEVAAMMMS